jgi:hypothetical protein
LIDLVASLHTKDLVLLDLTPNSVVIAADGALRLIDLEHVVRTGNRRHPVHTPGFGAPEQTSAPEYGPVPSQHANLYSLGACILYLTSGIRSNLLTDDRVRRVPDSRLDTILTLACTEMAALRRLRPLIAGLMHGDPECRWNLDRARRFIAEAGQSAISEDTTRTISLPSDDADNLLEDGLRYLLRTVTSNGTRLWRPSRDGHVTDPCNVQHGAAGVLSVLTRAAKVFGSEHLAAGVAEVAHRMERQLSDRLQILPGLYFGSSGIAWAMYDAARFIADGQLATRALDLARRVPVGWPNPGVCHGVAGAGMAMLHLWRATGDTDLLARAVVAADNVSEAAETRDGHLVWPIPAEFDSIFAGTAQYGFAHGVAGIGTFLLTAAQATGRDDYLATARAAGNTLAAVAELESGAAWWRSGEVDDPILRLHWCNGSSGVGTFLIRLWAATGEDHFRILAERAATAVRQAKWTSSNAACHGLAGDGNFLLDLADFTGEQRFGEWATELAAVVHSRHVFREGLMVVADETGTEVTADYGTGLSGTLGFLLRLRHGGPNWWLPSLADARERPAD